MSNCRDVERLFAPYVDGEAAAEQRASVDAHISHCPPCRDLLIEERAAREVLLARRQSLRACASTTLRARCAAQRAAARGAVASSAPHPGRFGGLAGVFTSRTWAPLSVAATLMLIIGGMFVYSAVNQVEALASQLALDHVKCFQFGSTAPQDPIVAAHDWAVANGWPVQVPASSPDRQLEFVSLRRCLVTDGRTAHMMYKWRGQPLSVFVVPEPLRDKRDVQHIVDKFGHEAIMWSSDGRTYVVMARGHPPAREIEPVVKYVRAAAR
jgi:anti-sigma factor RsiW